MIEGGRFLLLRMLRKALAGFEYLRYGLGCVGRRQKFVVVSCQRNSGRYAIECLESVYRQEYPRGLILHVFIDDASDDGTAESVRNWLVAHPDHNVKFLCNATRRGGTCNTIVGISLADAGAIVLEVNGDDWLPDSGVLAYLNRVYADEDVWMTYNSLRLSSGPAVPWSRPIPRQVVRDNAFRDQPEWTSSHLHSFRKRLYDHLSTEVMIDPETGDYWECADDQALYLSLLELAGCHSRHLHRITYVYNYGEASHSYQDNAKSIATAERIRKSKRYLPLERL